MKTCLNRNMLEICCRVVVNLIEGKILGRKKKNLKSLMLIR